jgi:hypothetical protein
MNGCVPISLAALGPIVNVGYVNMTTLESVKSVSVNAFARLY